METTLRHWGRQVKHERKGSRQELTTACTGVNLRPTLQTPRWHFQNVVRYSRI